MSIIGSLVGITVLVLNKVFNKKISAKWKCILWYIVILLLLISVRERDNNPFRDKDLVYFIDTTTGEIIGGSYSSGKSILY